VLNDICTPDILGYVEMKLPMSSQGRILFTSFWTRASLGDLEAEYKEKDQALAC